ncbi:MAG: hypothetical protein IT425_12780 [Pirellulales bacterium]|nr:hypothetical protein [Pirellulales bacterium]
MTCIPHVTNAGSNARIVAAAISSRLTPSPCVTAEFAAVSHAATVVEKS